MVALPVAELLRVALVAMPWQVVLSTVVTYALPEKVHVKIDVFNILGQKVVSLFDHEQDAGTHSVVWNGHDGSSVAVGSGVYFVKMQAGSFLQAKKMLLVR